jgi:hypothetical protein
MITTKKTMNWTSRSQSLLDSAKASEPRAIASEKSAPTWLIRHKLRFVVMRMKAMARLSKSVATLYSQKYFPKTNVQQKLNYFPYMVLLRMGLYFQITKLHYVGVVKHHQ